jgi:hypothetical protein
MLTYLNKVVFEIIMDSFFFMKKLQLAHMEKTLYIKKYIQEVNNDIIDC